MLRLAGSPARLRPHVKTHKCPAIVSRQVAQGIRQFKCATIAEAEMAAQNGGASVLLAKQPAGPDILQLTKLQASYPATEFLGIVDNKGSLKQIAEAFSRRSTSIGLLLDVDCGMGRTGLLPGSELLDLYRALEAEPALIPAGLHVYDGHLQDSNPEARRVRCAEAFDPVFEIQSRLEAEGLLVPRLVAGGSPTFPIHAANPAVTDCSPGTAILWDAGYRESFPDLPFQPAACLLTRVISRLSAERICLDLGYKAVSADKPQPRAIFPDLPDAVAVSHSEEHLVIRSRRVQNCRPGDFFLAIPRHVCPTVALYDEAFILSDTDEIIDRWPIQARTRSLGI